jgi:hypothetical protein
MTRFNKSEDNIRIDDVYPGHTSEWYAAAEANIHSYLQTLIRMAERRQPVQSSAGALDEDTSD